MAREHYTNLHICSSFYYYAVLNSLSLQQLFQFKLFTHKRAKNLQISVS